MCKLAFLIDLGCVPQKRAQLICGKLFWPIYIYLPEEFSSFYPILSYNSMHRRLLCSATQLVDEFAAHLKIIGVLAKSNYAILSVIFWQSFGQCADFIR